MPHPTPSSSNAISPTAMLGWIDAEQLSFRGDMWLVELWRNALQADATSFLADTVLYQHDIHDDVSYCHNIVDNGRGISPDQMRDMATVGVGHGSGDDTHVNFNLGARLTLATWNPRGVVFTSRWSDGVTRQCIVRPFRHASIGPAGEERAPGLHLVVRDGLDVWEVDDSTVWGGVAWNGLLTRRDDTFATGTVVTLLGSDEQPNSILGDPGRARKDVIVDGELASTLANRIVDMQGMDDIRVWTTKAAVLTGDPMSNDDYNAHRPKPVGLAFPDADHDTVTLRDGTVIDVWLAPDGYDPKQTNNRYNRPRPGVGVVWDGEVYVDNTGRRGTWLSKAAIDPTSVQERCIVRVTPHAANGVAGVRTDKYRQALSWFDADGRDCGPIGTDGDERLAGWLGEFAGKHPQFLTDAIKAVEPAASDDTYLSDYAKQLGDMYGGADGVARKRGRGKAKVDATGDADMSHDGRNAHDRNPMMRDWRIEGDLPLTPVEGGDKIADDDPLNPRPAKRKRKPSDPDDTTIKRKPPVPPYAAESDDADKVMADDIDRPEATHIGGNRRANHKAAPSVDRKRLAALADAKFIVKNNSFGDDDPDLAVRVNDHRDVDGTIVLMMNSTHYEFVTLMDWAIDSVPGFDALDTESKRAMIAGLLSRAAGVAWMRYTVMPKAFTDKFRRHRNEFVSDTALTTAVSGSDMIAVRAALRDMMRAAVKAA